MPAHSLFEAVDFRQQRARDGDEADVALREMDTNTIEMIELERASNTALFPTGTKHKMLDDQLAMYAKEIGKGFLAVRTVEDIGLLDLDPWQCAPLGGEPAAAGSIPFLLPGAVCARRAIRLVIQCGAASLDLL
jgi:hypothetical protein